MPREKRITRAGLIYHVINRGNNRQPVFLEDDDFRKYLGILYRFKKQYQFKLFAYCLMTNHVHLLIQVGEKKTISQIMQSITVAHTRHYHFKYQSSGHVWQGRFNSPIVSDDEYLLNVMKYIEQNPLRARMVKNIGEYLWSSYRLNALAVQCKMIDRQDNKVYQKLGETDDIRREQYIRLMKRGIAEQDLEDIRFSVKTGSYISEKFKVKIEQMMAKKRGRGRPRKVIYS
ncbi:MAG: transposase [Candidatus Omnitrophica bacterium]|nr:transposase [Candidatus Omnitrophota bacterium]